MKHYAGLDVSVKETSVCIVDETGKVCREVKVPSHPEDVVRVLKDPTWQLERVGLEAGPLSQWLSIRAPGFPVNRGKPLLLRRRSNMNFCPPNKLLALAFIAAGLTGCNTTQSAIQNVVAFAAPPEPAPAVPPVIESADPVLERAPDETLPLEPPSRSAWAGLDSVEPKYSAIYGEMRDGEHVVPAVKLSQISPQFLRKNVAYSTKEPPGAVVVDPAKHFLYFVEGNGRATRYGVGVGREGFVWAGEASIKNKQEWPDWYPPKEMIERRSDLKAKMVKLQSGEGMHGGPSNPLGARAMYLWQGDKDTLFRIHGTNEPWTIGHSESSGCIRMINQDAIDLYNKTQPGARVVVLGSRGAKPVEKLSQR